MRIKALRRSWRPGDGRQPSCWAGAKGVNETARLVGASPSSVNRWNKAAAAGPTGWRQAAPGPKPRLNGTQAVPGRPAQEGAVAVGHFNDLWTCRRVRDLIGRAFGVWYDPVHVWRILHSLGWAARS